MIYSLSIEISIEEFKVLREAVTSYRSEVWNDECCDEDVYPDGHPTAHYQLVDKIYHELESFKDRA